MRREARTACNNGRQGTKEEYERLLNDAVRNPQKVMKELILARLQAHYEASVSAPPRTLNPVISRLSCCGVGEKGAWCFPRPQALEARLLEAPGRTCIVAHTLDIVVRCFEEKHPGTPCVTAIFQPWMLRGYKRCASVVLVPT